MRHVLVEGVEGVEFDGERGGDAGRAAFDDGGERVRGAVVGEVGWGVGGEVFHSRGGGGGVALLFFEGGPEFGLSAGGGIPGWVWSCSESL